MSYALDYKPVHKSVRSLDLDTEVVLHTPEQHLVHVLNPSARLIWNLCDGRHSVQEIAERVRQELNAGPQHDVVADVQRGLEQLAELGLLD